jgi:hypothetical protein
MQIFVKSASSRLSKFVASLLTSACIAGYGCQPSIATNQSPLPASEAATEIDGNMSTVDQRDAESEGAVSRLSGFAIIARYDEHEFSEDTAAHHWIVRTRGLKTCKIELVCVEQGKTLSLQEFDFGFSEGQQQDAEFDIVLLTQSGEFFQAPDDLYRRLSVNCPNAKESIVTNSSVAFKRIANSSESTKMTTEGMLTDNATLWQSESRPRDAQGDVEAAFDVESMVRASNNNSKRRFFAITWKTTHW